MTIDTRITDSVSREYRKVSLFRLFKRKKLEDLAFQNELRLSPQHPNISPDWVGSVYEHISQNGGVQYEFMGVLKRLTPVERAALESRVRSEGTYTSVSNPRYRNKLVDIICEYESKLKDKKVSNPSDVGQVFESDMPWGGLLYWAVDEFMTVSGAELEASKYAPYRMPEHLARQYALQAAGQ